MLLSVVVSFVMNKTSAGCFGVMLAYGAEFFPLLVFALMVICICGITKGTVSAFMLSVLMFLLLNGAGLFFSAYKSFLFTSAFDWYRLFLGSYINFQKIVRVFVILCGYAIMFFAMGSYLFDRKEI